MAVWSLSHLDFTEARNSEWQWHQLGYMQISTLPQTDNNASTQPLSFLEAGCRLCRPTNSIKALKVPVSLLLVSSDTNCMNLFHPIRILAPQLHQHLHPHSACHLMNDDHMENIARVDT